eukprot:TRINITY_DN23748_c0_g2_i1.p1 TRINITY_DN23748_c0_g2~~TRINITY_DN23748_c0_g2_i1.p1  ORF type:complete len:894 (-),score=133.70 TRINITY_DN23748_c0_g2_i1:74-2755(-)
MLRSLMCNGVSTLFLLLAAVLSGQRQCEACEHPEEFVNTLGGTNSTSALSHGNVLPLVVRPWGMNAWTPDNIGRDRGGAWFFHPQSAGFAGVRCTHQPSPWMGDYGQFWILPFTSCRDGPFTADKLGSAQYSFNTEESVWKPYYWNASLSQGTSEVASIELTATQRGAALRVKFSKDCTGLRQIAVVLSNELEDTLETSELPSGGIAVMGMTKKNSGGVPMNCSGHGLQKMCDGPHFHHHLHVTIEGSGNSARSSFRSQIYPKQTAVVITQVGDESAESEVLIRVATSFISSAQAEVNHKRELAGRSFEYLMQEAKEDWRGTLARVDVQDVGEGYSRAQRDGLLEVFYTSLYRAVQYPRLLHEITEDGSDVHYSPYDAQGQTLPGIASTDSGFWDAFRAVYPLLSLVYPEQYARFIEGWLTAWKTGGWLPKWSSPGDRGTMPGTFGDAVLADAITKEIPGIDVRSAYSAARQDAYQSATPDGFGRKGLTDYMSMGFLPETYDSSVSSSLDDMLCDNALAHAAEALGKHKDASELRARASAYTLLFDEHTGFFRAPLMTYNFGSSFGRDESGIDESVERSTKNSTFDAGFSEFDWSRDYVEGGPWQYRFSVPWDVRGLKHLYSSAGFDLCQELERMMTANNTFGDYHDYGYYIHEQTEMAENCWGQYAHNNQPVHHVLYLFTATGGKVTSACARHGQAWLRKAMLELYKPGLSMYPGDEDNGDMGAWFVLSALGLYQLEPGKPLFTVGSPLFARSAVRWPSGGALQVVAENNGKDRPYVLEASWQPGDAQPQRLEAAEVSYKDLMQGGTLHFSMTGDAAAQLPAQPLGLTEMQSLTVTKESGEEVALDAERACAALLLSLLGFAVCTMARRRWSLVSCQVFSCESTTEPLVPAE